MATSTLTCLATYVMPPNRYLKPSHIVQIVLVIMHTPLKRHEVLDVAISFTLYRFAKFLTCTQTPIVLFVIAQTSDTTCAEHTISIFKSHAFCHNKIVPENFFKRAIVKTSRYSDILGDPGTA